MKRGPRLEICSLVYDICCVSIYRTTIFELPCRVSLRDLFSKYSYLLMAVPVVHTVCDRNGEAVSCGMLPTRPPEPIPSLIMGARHSPAAVKCPSTFPFSDYYQQCPRTVPTTSSSLSLGGLGAEQRRQIMDFGGISPTLLLCDWPGSSQPGPRVVPCPELRASVTARSLQLARSLFRALQLDAGALHCYMFSSPCDHLLVFVADFLP
jgi:hypothetical protein